jgi:O-antigen ligase
MIDNLTNKNNLLNLNFIIISIFPILLIVGPLFSEMGMLTIIFSFFYLNKGIFFKKINLKYFFIFVNFIFLLILSSLISDYKLFSLKSSLLYPRFFLFSLAISFFLIKSKNLIRVCFYFLLGTFLILIIDSTLQYFVGKNMIGIELISNRASSFFGDELILGSFVVRLFPLLIFFILNEFYDRLSSKFLLLIFTLICLVDLTVILSGERTSFFLLILQKIIIIISIKKLRATVFYNLLVMIMGLLFLINTSSNFNLRLIVETKQYTNMNIMSKNFRPYSTEHSELFETSYQMFLKNKFLGVGPKNFRNHCSDKEYKMDRRFSCSTHSHNFYLQLLAECGLFAFLILIYIYIKSFKLYFIKLCDKKNQKLKDSLILCLITFSCNFWPFVTSGNFFNNWMNMIMYLPLGFLIYNYINISHKNKT